MKKDTIILFGSAYMAKEYLKVLKHLNKQVIVIGRNEAKAKKLAESYGYIGYGNGSKALDKINCKEISLAIIASAIVSLAENSIACLEKGIKNILIEKPGGLNLSELLKIQKNIKEGYNVKIAYNRRYYSSVRKLKEILNEEKEIQGCFFDFTELEKHILDPGIDPTVLKRWGFANPSHVIDTAFFLIGKPIEIRCQHSGTLNPHPSGATFTGIGKTEKSLFCYFATWKGGGRWNIEVSTTSGRYRLCPLEELFFCKKNQFQWESIKLDDQDDINFKPGLKKMVKNMTNDGCEDLPTIDEQIEFCKIIDKIFEYQE